MTYSLRYDTSSKTKAGPSNDAGRIQRPKSQTLRERVLTVLSRGNFTPDEIAEKIGATAFAVRPRCSELGAAGVIEDTGERRQNASGHRATVWRKKQEG